MEPNSQSQTQAGSIGEILNGNVDLSCLMWVSLWLKNDDSFKWNCDMTRAIMENQPIQVLRLAGSHHFKDPFQNQIALILVGCACEMIRADSIKELKVDVDELETVQKSPSIDSLSELKQENLFDSWQINNPKRFKLKHNARQALIRHYKTHREKLSNDYAEIYAKRYDEPVEEIRRYFDEQPWLPGREKRRRSNPECGKRQETLA